MIALLVPLLFLFAAEPSPEPSAFVTPPTALKEIGRIQALPVCTAIVVHANSAISNALTNDQDVAIVINRLRTSDIDNGNAFDRRRNIHDLYSLATRIRTASSAGEAEVKRLRTLAESSSDAKRKVELKDFADSLGGALYRQKRIAVDLDKALVILEGRAAAAAARATSDGSRADFAKEQQVPISQAARTTIAAKTDSYNSTFREVADEFTQRTVPILSDEGIAADHSLGATTGC